MILIIETWKNIIVDFGQPLSYLLPAAIHASIILLLCMVWRKRHFPLSSLFVLIYGEVLVKTAFLSREPGSRSGIDLDLLSTWGNTAIAHAYFIENILMFIPFGVLMPILFKKMQKIHLCVIVSFFCSLGIEIAQLITQRGFCQLDDIVTNTIGALIGWLIWKFGRKA